MSTYADDAPMFFASSLAGVAVDGPNVILSFNAPVLSEDHKDRKYRTNVRIVMSGGACKQMVEFLKNAEANADHLPQHPMPETAQ